VTTHELVEAIRVVAGGNRYLSRCLTGDVFSEKPTSTPSPLSPREGEVLQKIAEGKSIKEIAFTFGVCVKTVETQRRQIMKKLNLRNIAELTKYAVREGIVSL